VLDFVGDSLNILSGLETFIQNVLMIHPVAESVAMALSISYK